MKVQVYDKVAWQLDGGMNEEIVLAHFKFIMDWCHKTGLLSPEGEEIYELGIDDSCSLHQRMFNEKGNLFMQEYYDKIADYSDKDAESLNVLFNSFKEYHSM